MKTNFNSLAWLKKLALSAGCMMAFGVLSASAFAQGNPGQPQFGGQPQYGQPQYGDPSQFGGEGQFGGPQGQFGPQQQQFNRPQQGQPGQFSQNPGSRQGQFGPSQQMNRPSQFRGQQQMGGQGQQFAGPNNVRGQNGSMQGRGQMPRTVGGSQRGQAGQFNRPQAMPGGNQISGNPGMNRGGFAQNGNNMQGMNRGQGGNPSFNPQGNPQAGRNFMNQNQGQSFQGQQFQGPPNQGQQFQGPQNQGPQFQGPQNQGQQFQGPQFQGPQNQGQQFQNQQFQNPQPQGQFGQNMAQNSPNSQSCQFCPEGTCPAGACQNGNCKNCPNGICSAKPAFGQPQGNLPIGGGFNGVMAPESDVDSAPIDLVLQNVELVFPGNPATQQGPVYRISVLNKSNVAVEDAFEVGLIATAGNDPDQSSPAAGERIASIAAGQVAVVEIQLPVEVNQMSKSEAGEPQPFTTLFVVVDARQEITEVEKSNNAAKLPRTGVRSVQPTQVSGLY